ncbi:MAG: UDP-N-acetylmuramoyl-L-alanine--D-glutamate ligase, partial [Clostridiaceae bacterium]|nr:UDP-N-acetylmuramoyl-L-alanine--D-glutamate ligase [Clostridiaceae bacterium]
IKEFAVRNAISCNTVETLEEATKEAYKSSKPGDIVLLSPACASWDQFKDFEIRGNMFKEYIRNLNSTGLS